MSPLPHPPHKQAAEVAVQARSAGEEGGQSLAKSISAIQALDNRFQASVAEIGTLSKPKGNTISRIANLISEIATQSKVLALNASVEAAGAGKNGHGFRVVAEEVKTLAVRTKRSAKDVADTIDQLQSHIEYVVNEIRTLGLEVKNTATELTQVGGQFSAIDQRTREMQEKVDDLAAGSEKTQQGIENIFHSIDSVNKELHDSNIDIGNLTQRAEQMSELAAADNARWAEVDKESYHASYFEACQKAARAVEELFERAISDRTISKEALFDRNYQPIAGTDPAKFHSRYDAFADAVLPAIQEPTLDSLQNAIFATALDDHGYTPTHNNRFNQALTGHYETDLINNRSKRIFKELVPPQSEQHKAMYIMTYKRDTGEVVHVLFVPIRIGGEIWGNFMVAYPPSYS